MKRVLLSSLAMFYYTGIAIANPDGGVVTRGNANISTQIGKVEINQTSPKALIDWNSFNIEQGEITKFNQPDANSITVNRIHDLNPSIINGTIEANGNIMLLNNSGILFGESANINVGGLIASTSSVKDDVLDSDIIDISEFTAPELKEETYDISRSVDEWVDINHDDPEITERKFEYITDNDTGIEKIIVKKRVKYDYNETIKNITQEEIYIKNYGEITTSNSGLVIFLGPNLKNTGKIHADEGKVNFLGGEKALIDLKSQDIVSVAADNNILRRSVINSGLIDAVNGKVNIITADSSSNVERQSIKNDGQISVGKGLINLDAGNKGSFANSGILSATSNEGGDIKLKVSSLDNSGKIEAKGIKTNGGKIDIDVSKSFVGNSANKITVSGQENGGNIFVTGGSSSNLFNSGEIKANGKGLNSVGGELSIGTSNIKIVSGVIEATGSSEGGKVRVGDLSNTKDTFLNPNSSVRGNDIVINSLESTKVTGRITGKKVEVSSKELAHIDADINAEELIIDPRNITISTTGFTGGLFYFEFIDPNPNAGNGFGTVIQPLSTGNIVISSPGDDFGVSNTGAVYLFNGASGSLISTLRSDIAETYLGDGGITPLIGNGNFVVTKDNWNASRGVATFVNGTLGLNDVVDDSNSIVGTTASDFVGFGGATPLTNGNYVLRTPSWNRPANLISPGSPAVIDAGAVTWCDGTTGRVGNITHNNSLIGGRFADQVGSGGVTALPNGNYIISSPLWDRPANLINPGDPIVSNAGAVTWCDGTIGQSGVLTNSNSLIGSTSNDQVGSSGIAVLSNSNYIVRSQFWSRPANLINPGDVAVTQAGATTWCSGTTGRSGLINHNNSLIGTFNSNRVGNGSITELSNGNYVITNFASSNTITWSNSDGSTVGEVSSANSLVGASIANGGVLATNNGNYIVFSSFWDRPADLINPGDPAIPAAGAVTWGNGSSGTIGSITHTNSLIGSTINDSIGSGFVLLSNGNYVVRSSAWDRPANLINPGDPAVSNAGAVTWFSNAGATFGEITHLNSLIGSSNNDGFGLVVRALTNGNYVVGSPGWDRPANFINPGDPVVQDAGAATWCNGNGSTVGLITAANSLYGSSDIDSVGENITALANGNYVVGSPAWNRPANLINPGDPAVAEVGAATWGDGNIGRTGNITHLNSIIGGTEFDYVGIASTALSNGNYVVRSRLWNRPANLINPGDPAVSEAGAATWANGNGSTVGEVSHTNSIIGNSSNDRIASDIVTSSNGNYVLLSNTWDRPANLINPGDPSLTDVGAVTWANGSMPLTGEVSHLNSIIGSSNNDQIANLSFFRTLTNGNYVFGNSAWDRPANLVNPGDPALTNAGAIIWLNGSNGQSALGTSLGPITQLNSIIGSNANGSMSAPVEDTINGTYLVRFASGGVGGRVFAAPNTGDYITNPNQFTFSRMPNLDVTIAPSFIESQLNSGTNVTLQANNDITVNSPINVSTGGTAGDLTLQAGRSVSINANITTDGGDLSLLANSTVADGVVDAHRISGPANINISPSAAINTSVGNVNILIQSGSGLLNNTSGNITLSNITANDISLNNNGPSAGNIELPSTATLTASNNLILNSAMNLSESGGSLNYSGATNLNLLNFSGYSIFINSIFRNTLPNNSSRSFSNAEITALINNLLSKLLIKSSVSLGSANFIEYSQKIMSLYFEKDVIEYEYNVQSNSSEKISQ